MKNLKMSSKEVKELFGCKVISAEVEKEMINRGYVKSRSKVFPFGYVYEFKVAEIDEVDRVDGVDEVKKVKRVENFGALGNITEKRDTDAMIREYLANGGNVEHVKDYKPSSGIRAIKIKNKRCEANKEYRKMSRA